MSQWGQMNQSNQVNQMGQMKQQQEMFEPELSGEQWAVYNALATAWKWKRHVWFGIWTNRQSTRLGHRPLWQEQFARYAFVEGIRTSEDGSSFLVDLVTETDSAARRRVTTDIRDIDAASLVVTR